MPFEVLSGFVTAPGATLTALTMAAGDSLTVRKTTFPKLLNVWADVQGAGTLRIFSPLMHDAAQGIRVETVVGTIAGDTVPQPNPFLTYGLYQPLQSQDLLTAQLSGSAVAGDIETAGLLMHYDDFPGSEGRFIDEATLRDGAVQPFTVENTLGVGTGGNWTGEEAINAEFDLYKAETDYALVGYQTDTELASLGWRGPDLANIRVGGPGNAQLKASTASWFLMLSREYGLAMVPVINAANKAATLLSGAQDENGVDPTVNSIFMQLTPEALKAAAATPAPTSRAPGAPPVTIQPRIPIGGRLAPARAGFFAPRAVT